MKQYDISVKSNLECGEPVSVRILSNKEISESILNWLKSNRLNDARSYCQNVRKVIFITL